ncbi:hypothetical protein [Streptomyces sp. YGL11-2]|uniref:hypothetical protein n=1 Tax=Streptomyces sp. YGL11-2 TaxID=3414028 RepID=UPI003CF80E21
MRFVGFLHADPAAYDGADAAFRDKYGYHVTIVARILTDRARTSTLALIDDASHFASFRPTTGSWT